MQRYREPHPAELALGLLMSHQIPGQIIEDVHLSAEARNADTLGGVKLQVPPEYYEQARALLDTTHGMSGLFQWLLSWRKKTRTFRCWSCGHPYLSGDPYCEGCGTPQPDSVSYERYVVEGRIYDAACGFCNTPYRRQDYANGQGPPHCAYCQRPLLFGSV